MSNKKAQERIDALRKLKERKTENLLKKKRKKSKT